MERPSTRFGDTDKADRFLGGKLLDQIDRDLIDRLTDAKLREDVTNAAVNRMLDVVRVILRKCRDDWEWVERIPKVRPATGADAPNPMVDG